MSFELVESQIKIGNLVMRINPGEHIKIGADITITFIEKSGGGRGPYIAICIEAPKDLAIVRAKP